ncbi:hypothetical protein BGZ76_002354 [Entomortierella beljakovae]|nr:hypothetical protein BGZ76_002354 [Entomortierella beljakovae]
MAVATLESHMIAQVANLPNSQRTGNFNIYSDTRCQDSSMRAIISYSIIRDANPAYKKRQLSDAFLNSTKDNFDPLNEYQIPNPSLADMVLDDVAGVKDPDYKSGGIGFEVVNMAEERPISIKKRQMPDASLNSTKERLNSQNERQTPRASLAKMVLDDIRGVKDRRYKSGGIGFERANMTEISHSINFSPKALEKRSLFKRQSGLCLLYTDLRPLAKYHYQCSTRDTLISRGMMLGKGQDRWTGDGLKRLYVHENGNVCLWHYPNDHPTMYWCWDHGKDYTKDADFRLYVIPDGRLCVNGDTGNYCSSINKTGLSDSFYRLTLQNDGNLVMYRGVFESILWATMSNRFNVEGPTPCTNA